MKKTLIGLSSLLCLAWTVPALCADEVILTVKGANKVEQNYTLAQLDAMPQAEISTTTPWTSGKDTYKGVALKTLLQNAKVSGDAVKVRALNDYWAKLPVAEAEKYQALLATHVNGTVLSRRNKGPLWVIFPLSERPELNKEKYHSYMVWQVRSIEAE